MIFSTNDWNLRFKWVLTVFSGITKSRSFKNTTILSSFEHDLQDHFFDKNIFFSKIKTRRPDPTVRGVVVGHILNQRFFFTGQRANYFPSTGKNPYRDFSRSNSKSPVQGENPYRDFFVQTQSHPYRDFGKSLQGILRSNSKSFLYGFFCSLKVSSTKGDPYRIFSFKHKVSITDGKTSRKKNRQIFGFGAYLTYLIFCS